MSRVTVASVANKNLLSLFDDFNEPCTAVILKKICQVFVRYSSQFSYLAQMIQNYVLEIYFFLRVFKKKGFCGLLSTWRPLFTFL